MSDQQDRGEDRRDVFSTKAREIIDPDKKDRRDRRGLPEQPGDVLGPFTVEQVSAMLTALGADEAFGDAHDVGWCNGIAAMTRADITAERLAESKAAAIITGRATINAPEPVGVGGRAEPDAAALEQAFIDGWWNGHRMTHAMSVCDCSDEDAGAEFDRDDYRGGRAAEPSEPITRTEAALLCTFLTGGLMLTPETIANYEMTEIVAKLRAAHTAELALPIAATEPEGETP